MWYALEDALVRRVERDPRWVSAGGGLIEDGERVRVRVEEGRDDEGGVAPREDREVDHVVGGRVQGEWISFKIAVMFVKVQDTRS